MKIPVSTPSLTEKEFQMVGDALKSGWISGTGGEYIDRFELEFSKYCGVKYGVACSSGTAALHLAMSVLDLQENDEVIVPAFTNIATILSVIYGGGKPVLVDSDDEIWGMDYSKIEEKINDKTRAIIPVHIYGHPVEMDSIMEIAKKNNLIVIEDAAEGHGAEYKGRKAGGIGDMGCFSFYANKIITTGEGGMLVTNNEKFAKKAKTLANLAFSDAVRYQHQYLGFNYRMSNLLAALGCAQLSRIEELIAHKRFVGHTYNSFLSDISGIQLPAEKSWAKNVYWMYGILIKDEFGINRDELREKLSSQGIETRTFFVPMNMQSALQEKGFFVGEKYPISEKLSKSGLYLPSGMTITKEEIKFVCESIRKLKKIVY
jgi:perosamine synthetase